MTMTLRARQWLLLAAVMLLVGSAVAWNLYATHDSIAADERERLTTQAELVEKNVTPQLLLANRVIENIIKTLPAWQAQKDGFRRANHELQVINDTLIGIRPILVIKADGTVVASSNPTLVGRNFAYREYFKTALNNPDPGVFHVSAPFKTVLDTFVISLFRSIRGPHGEFAGIVIVSVVPDYFSVLLDSVRYAPDMRAVLIHADGKLFLMMPTRTELEGTDLAKPGTFYSHHLDSGQKTSTMTGKVQITGEERMGVMRTIKPDDLPMDKPLLLVVGRDLSSIFADWRRNAYLQGVLFLMLLLTTTLGLYVYQKRLLEFNRLALAQSVGRKRVEDDLAKEKAFVETALDSLVDTFFVFEPRTGKAIRWNKALKELSGYADEEIATLKTPDAYYNQDDLNKAESAIASVASGSKAVVELNLICKDGRTIPMEYVATTVNSTLEKTRYVIAIGRNITERKRAEQVLRDSEARFRAIIEASPSPFVLNDERNNITYLNAAFTRTFGYTLDDIPTLSEWWPKAYPDPAYRQWVAATWQTYMEKAQRENTPIVPFELNICCKDGSVRTVMADVKPVVMTDEQAHLVSFYDITERKQAELEILRTKNLLQATLDAIPDLLFEVGLDGHIYNYHAHRSDLLAAQPEVFLGRTFSEILPAEVAQVCQSAIREAAEQGWSTGKDYPLQLPQGKFWFELSVAPMPEGKDADRHYIMLARDVTERKRLREQLLSFLENSAVVAWIKEPNGAYVFITDNYLRTFGLTRQDIIGKTHHEIWSKEIADEYERNDQRLLAQEGVMEVVEPAKFPDGCNSWWQVNKFVFHDARGKTMIGGMAVNITGRIQQEQQRLDKERAHRITLVREVHHRIKNNLQSIAGLLRRELGQFVELNPRLETAISQVNVIAVVHGLQGAELHETTRLYEVVRSICKSVADLALRPVQFQEQAEDSAVRRIGIDKGEAVSVALVLNELVLNAVKHSPASGSAPRVTLTAVDDAVQVVICNATTAAPGFDIVSGKGISTGLSLVRSLMPEQGAELTYELDEQGELVTTLKLASPVVFNPREDATSADR